MSTLFSRHDESERRLKVKTFGRAPLLTFMVIKGDQVVMNRTDVEDLAEALDEWLAEMEVPDV